MASIYDETRPVARAHSVIIDNRSKVVITGVKDVDSFNENEIILLSEAGYITLVGFDLHLSKLTLEEGKLVVEGEIMSLEYRDAEENRSKGGFMSRLFG
ncbi:MAG: sporulation protein YabP [Christensenellales bacterium]